MKKLYLDEFATTRVSPQVLEAMKPFFLEEYGNPSSLHEMGEKATKVMNEAREKLAAEINAKAHEIIFTSGGTESNNLALKGLYKLGKKKIIISAIEHPSIVEVCAHSETQGYNIVKIPVDKEGLIDINKLEGEIDSDTALVSIMHVNNIFGVVQDLEKIGKICKEKNVLFHTDAVQSFGKLDMDVRKMNIDMLSASAHKIGGPKGIGLLYVKEGVELEPMIQGGGQERDLRSGTENVPGIIGFTKALELIKKINKEKVSKVRDKLIEKLEGIGGKVNSSKDGLYNCIHVSFPGVDNETLVVFLSHKGIYVSAGSACDSKKEKEDYVLKAIGLNDDLIRGSIRISIGEDISEEDVDFIVTGIKESVEKLRV